MKNIRHVVLHVLQLAKIYASHCRNRLNSVFYCANQDAFVGKDSFEQRMVVVFHQNPVVAKMKFTKNVVQLVLKPVIINQRSVLDNVLLVASVLVRTTFEKATALAVLVFHVKSVQHYVKSRNQPKRFLLPCFFFAC